MCDGLVRWSCWPAKVVSFYKHVWMHISVQTNKLKLPELMPTPPTIHICTRCTHSCRLSTFPLRLPLPSYSVAQTAKCPPQAITHLSSIRHTKPLPLITISPSSSHHPTFLFTHQILLLIINAAPNTISTPCTPQFPNNSRTVLMTRYPAHSESSMVTNNLPLLFVGLPTTYSPGLMAPAGVGLELPFPKLDCLEIRFLFEPLSPMFEGVEAVVEVKVDAAPFNKIDGLRCPTVKVSWETLRLEQVRGVWSSQVTFGRAGESAATAESIFESSKTDVALAAAGTCSVVIGAGM